MALAALNTMVETTLTSVTNGMRGWLNNSVVTWSSASIAYYGVGYANNYNYTTLKADEAAKLVLIACTFYTLLGGIVPGKPEAKKKEIHNKEWIVLANSAALTFFAARYLSLPLNIVSSFSVITISYIAAKMVYKTIAKEQ